jgi:hypothetical protein
MTSEFEWTVLAFRGLSDEEEDDGTVLGDETLDGDDELDDDDDADEEGSEEY